MPSPLIPWDDTKRETREMSPAVSLEPTHYSGTIATWENWATEKSNLEHHKEIRCNLTERNIDTQRGGVTCLRSHIFKVPLGTPAAPEPLRSVTRAADPPTSNYANKQISKQKPILPSLFPYHLSSPVLGLYLAAALFPVLCVNGEHQLDETY